MIKLSLKVVGTLTILILLLVSMLGFTGNVIAEENPVYELVFSHHIPLEHPLHEVYKDFAKKVKNKTDGKVTVEVYGAGQMGGLKENHEGVMMGSIDLALVDFGTIAQDYAPAGVTSLPFIFKNYDHVLKFIQSDVLKEIIDETAKNTGARVLGYGFSGFRCMISNKPISSPEDMEGLKIRVPEINVWVNTMKALDANPTPVPWGEVYTSLQTGVVNAAEAPPQSLYSNKLYEPTDYIANTGHIFTEAHIVINESLYQSMSEECQTALKEAAKEAYAPYNKKVSEREDMWINKMVEKGLTQKSINTPEWVEEVKPVWENWIGKTGREDLVNRIRDLLKN